MLPQAKHDLFETLIGKFPNNKIREILLAAENLKVCRTLVDELELSAFVDLLEKHGLYIAIYDQKFICQKDAGKGGWISQYGIQVPIEVGHGLFMVYIASSPQNALDAMRQEHSQDDRAFGDLLAIPTCCSDFYVKHIDAALACQNDYLSFVVKNTSAGQPYSFWNNIAAQYFDGSLISFYPCSFNCKAAEHVSKESYQILCRYSEVWASEFIHKHKSNIIYTEYEGIYLLEDSIFDGTQILYDNKRITSTMDGVIFNALSRGNTLKVNNVHSGDIFIGQEHVSSMDSDTLNLLIFNKGGNEVE